MRKTHNTTKRLARRSVILLSKTANSNKYTRRLASKTKNSLARYLNPAREAYDYHDFYPSIAEYRRQLDVEERFKRRPLLSVVVPTYNTDIQFLRECIESVMIQSYSNWELCIADDASPSKEVVAILKEYGQKDERVRYIVRKKNGHISAATNSAIDMAKGEFIAFLDHDDILWPNALFEVVKAINAHPRADLIYSDEDKIDALGRNHSYPFFKPDWSPEFLESCNYITHLTAVRSGVVRQVGGFRKGYEGAQDWDLFIRVTEKTDRIVHIPKVLYSWRVHATSTASATDAKPYVYEAQHKLLVDHIDRLGRKGRVVKGAIPQHSYTQYSPDYTYPVTVILIGSVSNKLSWQKNLVEKPVDVYPIQGDCLSIEVLSRLPDDGVTVVVNCDKVRVPDKDGWLDNLVADAQLEDIGLVGPRAVSADNRVYAAGIGIATDGSVQRLLLNSLADDPHYMRGLYGRSRRNVVAVADGAFAAKTLNLKKYVAGVRLRGDTSLLEASLKMLDHGLRNIYDPNVTLLATATDSETESLKSRHKDPYMNPNFSAKNANFEVVQGGVRTAA